MQIYPIKPRTRVFRGVLVQATEKDCKEKKVFEVPDNAFWQRQVADGIFGLVEGTAKIKTPVKRLTETPQEIQTSHFIIPAKVEQYKRNKKNNKIKIVILGAHSDHPYWQKEAPYYTDFARGGLERGLQAAGCDVLRIDNRLGILTDKFWDCKLLLKLTNLGYYPDIILITDNFIHIETVRKLREIFKLSMLVYFFYDQHGHVYRKGIEIGRIVDLMLINNLDVEQWNDYRNGGVKELKYFAQGVEPSVYRPLNYDLKKKKYNLIFIGTDKTRFKRYNDESNNQRKQIIYRLAELFPSHLVVGAGWDQTKFQNYLPGAVGAEANLLLSQSKIAIGMQNYPGIYGSVSNRAYLTLSAGCPLLINEFKGIEKLFRYWHGGVVWWNSFGDLVTKIKVLLAEPDKIFEIGKKGRLFALRNHTYIRRAFLLKRYYYEWRKANDRIFSLVTGVSEQGSDRNCD